MRPIRSRLCIPSSALSGIVSFRERGRGYELETTARHGSADYTWARLNHDAVLLGFASPFTMKVSLLFFKKKKMETELDYLMEGKEEVQLCIKFRSLGVGLP
ncbi:hypothetical protein HAX54_022392 [Datura stramonium]|uniref:Uncharacterized protein n=1 Tax=Datura stramonium TaxID=4076 RepID=A0ABS8UV08_DATST|nr:hypothetical protein [Datura stramonium]